MPVAARGGEPGAAWRLVDWRGREVEGVSGAFDERGTAILPPLPAGYYRLSGESQISNLKSQNLACFTTLAVVPPYGGAASFFAADSAASYIARGAFDCPWNGGDNIRTIADLAQLAGIRHVRERMRWGEVQPSPDAPPDYSRLLAAADLFAERGIALSGCFHDAPEWTGRLQRLPGDLNALYSFCRETAAAFGNRMDDWEFWNEPDIHYAPEPVWDYAAALKAAYLGFKDGRPGVPVLNGALTRSPSSYEKALFANDAALYFDIFNNHNYDALSRHPEYFAKQRESLELFGAGDRPVWITECGAINEGPGTEKSVRPGLKAHSPGQELVVAEYCAKANISLQMEGVARNYFFILGAYSDGDGKKDWGMLRRDGTAKPVYSTLATMIRELGDATLLGALDAPAGIHAYLYEQPDGTQTVAYWAESPLDTVEGLSIIVEAEPDCAREWVLHPPAPAGAASFRLADMCGAVSAAAQDASGALSLPATRFPSYLSGLRGLQAAVPAKAATPLATRHSSLVTRHSSLDPTVILRVDLAPGDFEISGRKTLAVTKTEAPRLRVQVWNFGDTAKTGTVEAAGAILEGLPTEPFALPPRGSPPVEFDCVLRSAARSESSPYQTTLTLTGLFNGLRSTRLSMPILFEPLLLASCEATPLDWRDPALWERNDSAATYSVTWDEAEQAIRFDVAWDNPKIDRWFYPVLPLASPLQNAISIVFEVKTAQDKVENDFKVGGSNFMLVRKGGVGLHKDFIPYTPPTGAWERRYAELSSAEGGLGDVEAIRIGANPMGMRLTYWIRNLAILRTAHGEQNSLD